MKPHRLSLILLSLALSAQKTDQPVLRVTTHLVEVNVIVRNKNGPVRDLTQSDFTIFERGRQRRIAFFSLNAATASPVAAVGGGATQSEPTNLFTNRPAAGKQPASVNVILLDGLNTDLKDQSIARQQLLKFLRQIHAEDRVAVYALGAQLRVLNDFSSDAARLTATVARFSGDNLGLTGAAEAAPSDSPEGIGTDKIVIDAIRNQANDMISDYTIQVRAERTAAALEAIAAHIAGIPGRKNLIWITSGFPFLIGNMGDGQANSEDNAFDNDISGVTAGKKGSGAGQGTALYGVNDRDGNPARNQKSFTAEALRATRALNEANVAVYPVDARGLTVMPKSMTVEQNYELSRSQATAPPKGMSTILTGITAMRNIADATGGVVFQNGNDLQRAIRTAADDGEVTYTLGFYPDSAELDSRFHELKVQVRRRNVELRYRRGYTALPDAPLISQASALSSPLQSAGIGLTAGVEKADKAASIRIVIAIEPHDLSFDLKDSKRTAALDLVFAQRSVDGRDLTVSNAPLGLSLDPARYDTVFRQGLTITKSIELAPAAAELRVLVRDRATGRTGTLILPVDPRR